MNQAGPAWEITQVHQQRLAAGSAGDNVRSASWMLVDDGTVVLTAAGQSHLLRTGDAALVGGQVRHRLATHDGAAVTVADLRAVSVPYPLANPLVVRDFAGRHSGVAALVRRCPLSGPCSPMVLFASGYALLLGAAMTASWLEDSGREIGRQEPPALDPAVEQVMTALTANPGDAWSVERMAGSVHLSRSALGERFRRSLGQSPSEALREVRMRAARALLTGGDRPVEQVAYAVGYGSGAAFSRIFTALHGIGPQAWRDGSVARHPDRGEAGRADGSGHRTDEEHPPDPVAVEERAS
ncbi:AraC-like DNA-binding protein [Nocardioides albertanoniae]|uniref:AraC-like DNA-binding protein n=1 Tax=Nocardioides albertanoniae TaxID=1175486 RepID=A0A543ABF5_9ACTN|nr:AraC family transcriptional regulator [Nocardioides albertanoniae]TQL69860.1 AraC-like DNA-binding protein [Nocardioides albertanoniae]